ncbi:MAG: hypothetical protein HOJ16_00440 [Candidatus Peribacter sp.]|jgi:hypothetical protein|nr:hypothetical protein [Candidatus Peribacter sp.]
MTHLRYFAPLVKAGNDMGLKSTFFVGPSGKYNCPLRHKKELSAFTSENRVSLGHFSAVTACAGVLFSSEKTGIDLVRANEVAKKAVLTYQTDFIESHHLYEPFVDHILMPSKAISEYYGLASKKNLYLGIPKYDIKISKQEVLEKYNLSDSKNALIVWPKTRDANNVDVDNILNTVKSMGYTLLVKTRGKDPLNATAIKTLRDNGDYYFEDDSWHPHTTQELLEVSDFVINFGSTTIEESVMNDTPILNFDVKPEVRHGVKKQYRVTHDYLYKYKYCIEANNSNVDLRAAILHLTSNDFADEFAKARLEHLFDNKNVSMRIIERLVKNVKN